MKALCLALLALALCGCGSTTTQGTAQSPASDNGSLFGQPRDARSRAIAHTELASAYLERGNLGVALEEAKIAAQADSTYAPAQNVLGLVYMELKETPQAQASFERALEINPQDSDTNHNMGQFLCENGRELDSIKYFMAAIQNPLYKTPAKTYAAAGACYEKAGRTDEAFADYGRAVSLNPNYVPALLPYARLQMAHGSLEGARATVSRYNALVPPTAESLWLLLRIERRRGDAESERRVAAVLGQRFPDSKEYRAFQRGEVE